MKKLASVIASLALAAPMAVQALPESGDKSFTLSGTGSSDKDFNDNAFGVSGELGFYTSDHLMWGVRQSVNGSAGDDVDDAWSGSTRVFIDWHFLDGNTRPYIGANLGGIYGDNVNESGTAGLETGVRWFVLDKTFIGLGLEYAFLFEDSDDVDDSYDDGAFFYTLGVGFNF